MDDVTKHDTQDQITYAGSLKETLRTASPGEITLAENLSWEALRRGRRRGQWAQRGGPLWLRLGRGLGLWAPLGSSEPGAPRVRTPLKSRTFGVA